MKTIKIFPILLLFLITSCTNNKNDFVKYHIINVTSFGKDFENGQIHQYYLTCQEFSQKVEIHVNDYYKFRNKLSKSPLLLCGTIYGNYRDPIAKLSMNFIKIYKEEE